eukprot:g27172.t1
MCLPSVKLQFLSPPVSFPLQTKSYTLVLPRQSNESALACANFCWGRSGECVEKKNGTATGKPTWIGATRDTILHHTKCCDRERLQKSCGFEKAAAKQGVRLHSAWNRWPRPLHCKLCNQWQ